MIGNVSRLRQFDACEEKAYNWDELHLVSYRDADPLMTGEAYHKGSEILAKLGDVEAAVIATEAIYRKRLEGQMILPEELPEIERQIEFAKHAVKAWARHYDTADFKILWPEVNGLVPLPNTRHHCFFVHRIFHPDNYDLTGCADERCFIPHHLKFKTDGVLEFYHKVWLLEQKTTTSTARNHFWEKWNMEFQIGCYMYGVWRKTGVRPAGTILNAIIKHQVNDNTRKTENGGYKKKIDPTNVGFERDQFVYTEKMLLSFERDLIIKMNHYEQAFADPENHITRNTDNCFDYNRACYYWQRCQRKFSGLPIIEEEFRQRDGDYVEKSYYELLGIDPPTDKKFKDDELVSILPLQETK